MRGGIHHPYGPITALPDSASKIHPPFTPFLLVFTLIHLSSSSPIEPAAVVTTDPLSAPSDLLPVPDELLSNLTSRNARSDWAFTYRCETGYASATWQDMKDASIELLDRPFRRGCNQDNGVGSMCTNVIKRGSAGISICGACVIRWWDMDGADRST